VYVGFCCKHLSLLVSSEYNIIITMAQQPFMGPGLLFSRLLSRAHSWQLVTGQLAALLVLSILMCPPEPSEAIWLTQH
jgi:hypothetical protein